MLLSLCAHKLDVAIFTASEKFIDRFAVVSDKDRFAVVLGNCSDRSRTGKSVTSGIGVEPVSGLSMAKLCGGCPHPNIRGEPVFSYRTKRR